MFRDLPKSITATMDVAEQINVELTFGKYHVPEFVPDTGESPDALFDRLLDERLHALFRVTLCLARDYRLRGP